MQKILRFHAILSLTLVAVAIWATSAKAITIELDYSSDATDSFFGDGNPQGATAGAQAKAAMDAAAAFYNGILGDTFSAIDPPSKFYGSLGGEASFFWKRRYFDPATGNTSAAVNVDIAADKFVVFVGARDLLDDKKLGLGGPGGFVLNNVIKNGQFTTAEDSQISQMQSEFSNAVKQRGEASGFGLWGGSIAFNSKQVWHFDHLIDPPADLTPNDPSDDVNDFYSVALHELAHTLGFGATDDNNKTKTPWEALVDGTDFTGGNVKALLGTTIRSATGSRRPEFAGRQCTLVAEHCDEQCFPRRRFTDSVDGSWIEFQRASSID